MRDIVWLNVTLLLWQMRLDVLMLATHLHHSTDTMVLSGFNALLRDNLIFETLSELASIIFLVLFAMPNRFQLNWFLFVGWNQQTLNIFSLLPI